MGLLRLMWLVLQFLSLLCLLLWQLGHLDDNN